MLPCTPISVYLTDRKSSHKQKALHSKPQRTHFNLYYLAASMSTDLLIEWASQIDVGCNWLHRLCSAPLCKIWRQGRLQDASHSMWAVLVGQCLSGSRGEKTGSSLYLRRWLVPLLGEGSREITLATAMQTGMEGTDVSRSPAQRGSEVRAANARPRGDPAAEQLSVLPTGGCFRPHLLNRMLLATSEPINVHIHIHGRSLFNV